MMNGLGWGMDGGGWIWMILGIFLVVAPIWFFGIVRPGGNRSPTDDAAATLRSRFARGEITTEEYEQARRVLGIK
jgi:putative membrane protein